MLNSKDITFTFTAKDNYKQNILSFIMFDDIILFIFKCKLFFT